MATHDLGEARERLMEEGKWAGRSQASLKQATYTCMNAKKGSCEGTIKHLCISPKNGQRVPCDVISLRQSIIGDCQSASGMQPHEGAQIKNRGSGLIEEKNALVEALLCSVTVSDDDIVREIVHGCDPPRSTWVTGDNIYVSGLDMSWENFKIGDLLVMESGVVIVNTGYPHFACWKYAVRTGQDPKEYINSVEGVLLRMRGIKGAVLLPASSSSKSEETSPSVIRVGQRVRLVRRFTREHTQVIQKCRTPLMRGSEVMFRDDDGEVLSRASAEEVTKYVSLLLRAGRECAKKDAKQYDRELPKLVCDDIGILHPKL